MRRIRRVLTIFRIANALAARLEQLGIDIPKYDPAKVGRVVDAVAGELVLDEGGEGDERSGSDPGSDPDSGPGQP